MNPLFSLFSGGLLGFLGSVGTGVMNIYSQMQRNKHDIAMEVAKRETMMATQSGQLSIETIKAFSASYDADKATYWKDGSPWWMACIEFARGFTRPGACWHYIIASDLIAIYALWRTDLSDAAWGEISKASVYAAMQLTGICVGWYFGSRSVDKGLKLK